MGVKRRRILVLLREGLEPPASIEGLSKDEIEQAPWKTEFFVVDALRQLGHEVHPVSVHDDLLVIRQAIEESRPHLAFNLLEEFASKVRFDQHVVAYLELMGVPYTGCNPRGLMLSRDKALAKKLLTFHKILVPDFAVFLRRHQVRRPRRLRYPLFIKSVTEDASLGISQASLVKDDEALAERVAFVHQHANTAAIAEEFIPGRELYVGVLGNRRLQTLPIWELLLTKKPEHMPLIATARAKWNLKYQKRWGVISRAAQELPEDMQRRIVRTSKRIFRILGLSGYARLDYRLTANGRLFFLEANGNPQISRDEDFAEAARTQGLQYPELIQRVVNLGLRWGREG